MSLKRLNEEIWDIRGQNSENSKPPPKKSRDSHNLSYKIDIIGWFQTCFEAFLEGIYFIYLFLEKKRAFEHVRN